MLPNPYAMTRKRKQLPYLVALLSGLLVLSFVPSTEAASSGIDLREGADVVIVGTEGVMDAASIASAGDVNGDGVADVLVSSCRSPYHPVRSGLTFVVFGEPTPGTVHLDGRDATRGFRIEGPPDSYACWATSAGDLNGDGLDDVAVGAPGADPSGRTDAGAVYVVFGKNSTTSVNLASFDLGLQGAAGFRIDGPKSLAFTGTVADLGDVDGDQAADLIVGSPGAAHSYVILGKKDSAPVDLAAFHEEEHVGGYRIAHPSPDTTSDLAVGGGGDFNADGIPDALVAYSTDQQSPGVVAVIFGKKNSGPLDTRRLGSNGFKVRGENAGDSAGFAVDRAGDVNSDGRDDILIGAPRAWDRRGRGHAYVVFGSRRTTTLRLDRLGKNGFKIRGRNRVDRAGMAVAGIGDVDGDHLDDVMVGAPLTRVANRGAEHPYTQAGAAFIVYGKRTSTTVRLGDLQDRGYIIKGAEGLRSACEADCYGDWAGASVAPAGDMNDDGHADVIIGAPFARGGVGAAYVIWTHPFLESE